MTFTSILTLVVVATIILALLFVFFHILVALLPLAIIAILVLWLVNKFSGKKSQEVSSSTVFYRESGADNPPRKKARNVTTKDVDK